MYTPKHFEQTDHEKIVNLVRSNPFGTLVLASDSELIANHLPFVADVANGLIVRLRAHAPRANSLSSTLNTAHSCIAIFHGAEGYISPSWYATKKVNESVVPTWNYAVVHIHGQIEVKDDVGWVMSQLNDLTDQSESDREHKWSVSDAPEEFVQRLAQALVGLEITVSRIEGKTKASQNQPKENQSSILRALAAEKPNSDLRILMTEVLED